MERKSFFVLAVSLAVAYSILAIAHALWRSGQVLTHDEEGTVTLYFIPADKAPANKMAEEKPFSIAKLGRNEMYSIPTQRSADDADLSGHRPAQQSDLIYEVRLGDTLQRISKHFYDSYAPRHYMKIMNANPGVKPESLHPGMRLKIPEVTGPQQVIEIPRDESSSARTYVVRSGDSLSAIAQSMCGSVREIERLRALNPQIKKDNLSVGQRLTLPPPREEI